MLGLSNGLAYSTHQDAFNVADINGLAHWYKYQTNFTLSGSNVTTWGDSFGSNDLSKSGASNILYNSGDVDFDTNGGKMSFGSTWNPGSFAFYIVFKITAGSIVNEEIANSDSSNFFRLNSGTEARIRIGNTTNNDITLSSGLAAGSFHAIGIEWDGTTINIYSGKNTILGTAEDTDEFAGLSTIGLRGNQFDGHIREIVLVNNTLSAGDRAGLFEHLEAVRDK